MLLLWAAVLLLHQALSGTKHSAGCDMLSAQSSRLPSTSAHHVKTLGASCAGHQFYLFAYSVWYMAHWYYEGMADGHTQVQKQARIELGMY